MSVFTLWGILKISEQIDQRKNMGSLGTAELIIILIVLLALFGGKKIPGIARSLGRSLNEFKAGLRDEPSSTDTSASETEAQS